MPPADAGGARFAVDRLLLVELSANLYSTWGRGWRECLQVAEHLSCLRLFLWCLSRALEAEVPAVIETVADTGDCEVPCSFRLWLPLHGDKVDRFTTACAAALPVAVERDPKRPRIAVAPQAGANLMLKRDVVAAFQTYGGGAVLTDVSAGPILSGDVPATHILQLLAAGPQLARACGLGRVDASQRRLDTYLATPDGETHVFAVPDRCTCHKVATLNLAHGDELLGWLLPHVAPTDVETAATHAAISHATAAQCTGSRPTKEAGSTEDLDESVLESLLRQVYPVLERVRVANRARIAKHGLASLADKIEVELTTLLSQDVPGVPSVYHATRQELAKRLAELRGDVADEPTRLAQGMFFRPCAPQMSTASSTLAAIVSGACGAARLLPAQRKLWLLLYLRSHKIAANHLGSNCCIVCCGPPETGKSNACHAWLAALPRALVQVKDVVSAKSYTAMDPSADLRACFRDEMHELARKGAADDPNTKAQQTLWSNGIIMVERLVRDADGTDYVLTKQPKAGRALMVTCTNNLHEVPAPILSRATIVAVPATGGTGGRSAATLASIGRSNANSLCQGFFKFSQALAAMQVDFWAADAVGVLTIDDRMVLLFRLIAEAAGLVRLSARKMIEVRHMAVSLMVLDLGSRWFRYGEGAAHGFCRTAQLEFYAANAVVTMEHVLQAVSVSTMTTNVDHELRSVQLALRAMLKTDPDGSVPPFAGDTAYYELSTSRRQLENDTASRTPALGPGLTKSILAAIATGMTGGKPNIRYMADDMGHEHALVNAEYMTSFLGDAEKAMLASLAAAQWVPSWCGEFRVFRAGIRARHTTVDARCAALTALSAEDMTQALSLLSARTVRTGSSTVHVWQERDRADVRVRAPDSPHADTAGTVRKSEVQALCVHKSLFGSPADGAKSAVRDLYIQCLAVAGGYGGRRVAVGMGPNGRGAATLDVPLDARASVTVDNPLYVSTAALADLLGDSNVPRDSVFPGDQATLAFTEQSELERRCRHDQSQCATPP